MARREEKTFYQDSRARVILTPGLKPEEMPSALTGRTTPDPTDPSGKRFFRDEFGVDVLVGLGSGRTRFNEYQIKETLTMLDVARRLGAPGGSFTFVVKDEHFNLDAVSANDWVEIYIDNGQGERLEMVGLIDRVQEATQATPDHTTTQTYTISGREAVGKALAKTEIFYDIRAKPLLAVADFSKRIVEVVNGIDYGSITASTFVPEIIKGFAGKDAQFIHPRTGLSFLSERSEMVDLKTYVGRRRVLSVLEAEEENDLLDKQNMVILNSDGTTFRFSAGDVVDDDGLLTRRVIPNSLMSIQGKLWSAIQRWQDPRFHTLYFDVLPDEKGTLKTALVFKQHPYDIDVFFDLADHDVFSTEVVATNIGRSDADLVNWVKILTKMIPQGRGEGATIFAEPLLSPESLNTHGIRRLYDYTIYPFPNPTRSLAPFGPETAAGEEGGFIGLLNSLNGVIARWHSFNDLLVSGTIAMGRLRNDIRLGQRVNYFRRGDEGFSFLVEGIRHQYVYQGVSTTTINVTRGIPLHGSSQYTEFIRAAEARVSKMGGRLQRDDEGVRPVNFGPVATGEKNEIA